MTSARIAALSLALIFAGLIMTPTIAQGLRDGLTVTYKSPPAPELRLWGLDGAEHDLSTMKGQVVVINFWATWCPPCIEEMPSIQKMWEKLRGRGLEVLGVNLGEPADTIRAFLDEFDSKLEFPILLDPEGEAFRAWGARGLPKTYVVNKRGRIIYEAEGGRNMDSEHIRGLLQTLIDE